MRGEKHKPDHFPRNTLRKQVPHGKEVPQALGHLLALDLQHLVVHPDFRHLAGVIGTAALGNLVFVVRKLQVQPAAVDIKRIAEQCLGHRGAFNMPAWTPTAPRRLPPRLILA